MQRKRNRAGALNSYKKTPDALDKLPFGHYNEGNRKVTFEIWEIPAMAALYQKYLADEPLFLLYSIRDGMENPQEAVEMLDQHVGQFAARMQKSQNDAESGQDSKS